MKNIAKSIYNIINEAFDFNQGIDIHSDKKVINDYKFTDEMKREYDIEKCTDLIKQFIVLDESNDRVLYTDPTRLTSLFNIEDFNIYFFMTHQFDKYKWFFNILKNNNKFAESNKIKLNNEINSQKFVPLLTLIETVLYAHLDPDEFATGVRNPIYVALIDDNSYLIQYPVYFSDVSRAKKYMLIFFINKSDFNFKI